MKANESKLREEMGNILTLITNFEEQRGQMPKEAANKSNESKLREDMGEIVSLIENFKK